MLPIVAFGKDDICNRLLASIDTIAPHLKLKDSPPERGVIDRLLTGAPESFAHHSEIDAATFNDLELNSVLDIMDHSLTEPGRLRLRWRLTHPNLDSDEIRKMQTTFQYLTRQTAEWGELRKSLRGIAHSAQQGNLAMAKDNNDFFKEAALDKRNRGIFLSAVNTFNSYGFVSEFLKNPVPRPGVFFSLFVVMMLSAVNIRETQPLRVNLLAIRDLIAFSKQLKDGLNKSKDPYLSSLGKRLEEQLGDETPLDKILKRFKYVLSPSVGKLGDGLFAQGLWTLKKLANDIKSQLNNIASVLDVIADVDYLTGLTLWIREHEEHLVYPEVVDSEIPFIDIEEAHQPYIVSETPEKSIPNGFRSNTHSDRFFILTGPNKAGKSTYVRAIAVNILGALMSLPVAAKSFRLTPMHVMTNMDITDSMAGGKSYYDAETDRLASIFKVIDSDVPTFLGLDEILLGTNSEERQAAEKSFINYTAARNHITILALHDLAMAKLEGKIPNVRNIHVDEIIDASGRLFFPYKVKPGVTPHRNGLRLLREKKFPKKFLDDADRFFAEDRGEGL